MNDTNEKLEQHARDEWRSSFTKLGDDEIGAVINIQDNTLDSNSSDSQLSALVDEIKSFDSDDTRFDSADFQKIKSYLNTLDKHSSNPNGVSLQFTLSSLSNLLSFLKEHVVHFSDWLGENESRIESENHDDIHNEPVDDYDRYGLKRSDF